jgi:predicted acylesterase/phospholipase RssA
MGVPNKRIEHALVLSAGGGRGAYQVGVCKALQDKKWWPDMVLGTSIGATNGAMFIAPKTEASGAKELEKAWHDGMLNEKLHGASTEWPSPWRELLQQVIEYIWEKQEPSKRPTANELVEELAQAVLNQTSDVNRKGQSILDTIENALSRTAVMQREHWGQVLKNHVSFNDLNSPEAPYFGVAVTDVATGALQMLWNRVPQGVQGLAPKTGIQAEHLLASSSIPGIYQYTELKEPGGRYWWDGVLVANTPIAPAIVAKAKEIVIVLMTPWFMEPKGVGVPLKGKDGVPTILDALERVLDWVVLAPLRSELCRLDEDQLDKIKIIAPTDKLMSVFQIIDYGKEDIDTLITWGEEDAKKVLGKGKGSETLRR